MTAALAPHRPNVARQSLVLSRRAVLSMVLQPQVIFPSLFFPLFFAALNAADFDRVAELIVDVLGATSPTAAASGGSSKAKYVIADGVAEKTHAAAEELATYLRRNAGQIINYDERHRADERISTGFVQSAVN